MTAPSHLTEIILAIRKSRDESDAVHAARVEELRGLCEAAGGIVQGEFSQERPIPDNRYYLGSGKIEEIVRFRELHDISLVVFDGELSPGQVRNLEAKLDCRVIDRTQLILDIFAQRANTREGRLQVEIAQLQYLLPRLTGRGVEMSRLGGGIGTRGPGETKLEVDRRRIRARISRLKTQLDEVKRNRAVQRAKRSRSVPVAALVGYTNAGKTTLLHKWSADKGGGKQETGQARLFDTLDPSARKVRLGVLSDLVVMDTVGFVQNLPHLLVDAFRATLEEVLSADVIIQVVDASHEPDRALRTTYQVLEQIGALDKEVITFFNKMDRATIRPAPDVHAVTTIYGSAMTGEGMQELYQAVDTVLAADPVNVVIDTQTPGERLWKEIVKRGKVLEYVNLDDNHVRITLSVGRAAAHELRGDLVHEFPLVNVEFGEEWTEP